MKVTAKSKDKPAISVEVPIGTTLADLNKQFGEDVVTAHAKGALVITCQAFMRRLMSKGKSAAEVQAAMKDWKPDVRSGTKLSAMERAAQSVEKLSPTERAELLKKLQSLK